VTTTATITAPAVPARRRNRYLAGLLTPRGVTGLVLVGLVVLAGLAAPLLTSHDPLEQGREALAGPGGGHLFGTDDVGRDVFARVLYGIRTDLVVVLAAVPLGALAGCLLALVSIGSRVADVAVQRLFDATMAFPALVMGLMITAVLGFGKGSMILVIALVEVPAFGRMLRGQLLVLRTREYAVAARVGGAGPGRLFGRHLLPNAADPIIVQLAVSLSVAVVVEGAMSFVGIGIRPPDPSLGAILANSVADLETQPMYGIGPLVVITALVLGLNLIAEALNEGIRR
jgi:peptide/nickel transport system permease protein